MRTGTGKPAKDHNCNRTGGDGKTSPFYEEIDFLLVCRDITTFSRAEESSGSTDLPKTNEENDDDLYGQFEQSLTAFGLNRKGQRKSQRRDERKQAKASGPAELKSVMTMVT